MSELFPEFLSGAVEKVTHGSSKLANISMVFPTDPESDCQMNVVIMKNKVEYSAAKLCGLHIESDDQSRYLLTEDIPVEPKDNFIFRRMKVDAIRDYFGDEVNAAIASSRNRSNENMEGKTRTTSCGSMLISCDPSKGATISLVFGLLDGQWIRNKLYLPYNLPLST